MDHESQKLFDTLIQLQPFELRETDIAFLKSRVAYFTPREREKFAEVLGLEKPKQEKKKSE